MKLWAEDELEDAPLPAGYIEVKPDPQAAHAKETLSRVEALHGRFHAGKRKGDTSAAANPFTSFNLRKVFGGICAKP